MFIIEWDVKKQRHLMREKEGITAYRYFTAFKEAATMAASFLTSMGFAT